MSETLYFNGVKGDTGRYGLEPMTVTALADRVLGARYASARQLHDLQRQLIDRTLNERKLLDIVSYLVRDAVRARSPSAERASDWPSRAARKITAILLGDDVTASDEDIEALAARIALRPVETIVHIVRLLNGGQGIALARWLLSRDETQSDHLRKQLTSRFDQALQALRRTYLLPGGTFAVGGHGSLSPAWVDRLSAALARLPVPSLAVLEGSDAVVESVRRLVRTLRALARASDGGASALPAADTAEEDFGRQLAALAALGPSATWHGVVANLNRVLRTLQLDPPAIRAAEVGAALLDWLGELQRRLTGSLAAVPWVDPMDLSEAGWGIVFPATLPAERQHLLEMALAPLLQLRSQQAGSLYRFYAGAEGYRPGDTASSFLRRPPRHADAANPAAPAETGVPYYLLLVGSPQEIPFDFQYQLDVQYAVGRLDLGQEPAPYVAYARNVVSAETEHVATRSQVVLFGPRTPGDPATELSATHLIAPLARHVKARTSGSPWQVLRVAPEHATKANLSRILQLERPPALLFTATHGIEYPAGDPRQRTDQGALLCKDWTGEPGEVPTTAYFAARDVDASLNLKGMIWFAFACFGAGTPEEDEYHRAAFRSPQPLAEAPFVAALPQAILGLPERGALAVIGHVERSWGLSFLSEMGHRPEGLVGRRGEHIEVFAAVVERLLEGMPIGSAMDYFDMRHAALATELTYLYDRMRDPPISQDLYRLAELWTASNDARGYIILGDPAVRLRDVPFAVPGS